MIRFELLHPMMTEANLGILLKFLDPDDPHSAAEQFDANYQHGGGWSPFHGFKLAADNSLTYPDDEPLPPRAIAKLHDETIVIYDHAWVAIIQPDRSFEVCRMD